MSAPAPAPAKSLRGYWQRLKDWATRLGKAVWTALVAAALAVAAFFGYDATSQQAPVVDQLSWTAPSQYVDGTTIPAGTLTGTRVAWSATAGGTYTTVQDVPAPAAAVSLTRDTPYGTRCYKVAALIGAENGEWSEAACKTVRPPAAAPTDLRVE